MDCILPLSDKQTQPRTEIQDKAPKTTPKITRTRKRLAKRRTSPTTTSPKSKKNRKDHETDSIQQVQTIR